MTRGSPAKVGTTGAIMRTREQWLALAVLLGCLVFLDVAPPEFSFDTSAVPVQTPLAAVVDRFVGP